MTTVAKLITFTAALAAAAALRAYKRKQKPVKKAKNKWIH
jgi:hypothetical protein